ncbi:YbaB/EbfC family nucleoid-associated protein [Nocardia sp. CDC153]|uniref:YbaB/EbfC family nucleoid-associated protein n=1 Tax=Nocardia sp. CDC153 TaxID=3112167 RepID=UPI002DBFB353|nr:YbaB/EbfC family nucleoid-associated protein [Nocardia sp. CDC153]MEC3954835.1 YbaB/EbfC family nucleoid-associated protein [Nocardia sp. CDC153]
MSAEMDALLDRVNQQLETLEATLHGLAQVRARFTAEDHSVTAEVDADGALTGLWLAESVTARSPSEVSRLILWACQQAASEATAQRSRIIARLNESIRTPADISGHVGGSPDSA